MTIYLEDDYDFFTTHEAIYRQVQKVIDKVLDLEAVPYETEISLTVVEKDEIQAINASHRDKDQPTDVLSFPQIEPEANGVIGWETLNTVSLMNFDTEELILGDIVLCYQVAEEQAIRYGHSLEREVCFLVAHSMLHLLGYDHMNPQDEQLMMTKQTQVLDALQIIR